jgi:predicted acetyltransferase
VDVTIGTASQEEAGDFLRPISVAFGRDAQDPERTRRFASLIEPERMHVAREGGAIVGSAGAFTYELTVPGGFVPAAGVTVVGVLPTHRRRGILRRLMREQLDDVRRRGEPVAYLWASEERIYGRFGYGLASWVANAEVDVPRIAFADGAPADVRVRLLDADAAFEAIPAVYDRVRAQWPGMFSRSESWWRQRKLLDSTPQPSSLFRAVLELDGEPEAYALYRVSMDFERMGATMELDEALGTSEQAMREIWRYLTSVDLVKTIRAGLLSLDHPLFLMVDQPRALNLRVWDGLWLRVVDVEAALAARALGDADVVLEVRDAFCDWNEGRWRVTSGGAARTDAEPGLRCDVTALGSAYLGGVTWGELVRAGRAAELTAGAAAAADVLFGWERKPWCPEIF